VRYAIQRAIHIALDCPTLSSEAADDVAAAQGMVMRRTGHDVDDARNRMLRVATMIDNPWSNRILAELIGDPNGP
jgi:hypothetical protein